MDLSSKTILQLGALAVVVVLLGVFSSSLPALPDKAVVNEQFFDPDQIKAVLPLGQAGLGSKLVAAGVIDPQKFSASNQSFLSDSMADSLTVDKNNAQFALNFLWGLGLTNQNEILFNGPMGQDNGRMMPNFASTGGWTLGVGDPMNHYGKYQFIVLTPQQQALVDRISRQIYRPCCDNSTYFPDCNHGMAMLAALELLAAAGDSEEEMFQTALKLNALWFPDAYANIGTFVAEHPRKRLDAKDILGFKYSSASGYRKIMSQIHDPQEGGASCSA